MSKDWREELVADSTFFQAFRKSRGALTVTFNLAALLLVTFLAIAIAISVQVLPQYNYNALLAIVLRIAQVGQTMLPNIFGFFVAGFAILVTIPRIRFFKELGSLASRRNPGVSELRDIFLNFVNYFVHLMSYLSATAIITALSGEGGGAAIIREALSPSAITLAVLTNLLFFILCLWTALVFLKTKSFMWNVYSVITLYLALSDE